VQVRCGFAPAADVLCKTVGSAYASSNLAPATTSENVPGPAMIAACGPFARCRALLHYVPSRGAVSQWLRTDRGLRERFTAPPVLGAARPGAAVRWPCSPRGPFSWFRQGRPAGAGTVQGWQFLWPCPAYADAHCRGVCEYHQTTPEFASPTRGERRPPWRPGVRRHVPEARGLPGVRTRKPSAGATSASTGGARSPIPVRRLPGRGTASPTMRSGRLR
jgi:hypothetical protein